MPDDFLRLSADDRREALQFTAAASDRPAHLLEKDVWLVWALDALFSSSEGAHLVFKGGTSLSKVYKAIRRFSEDVDLTYDIRAMAADLVGTTGSALPKSASQQKRWTAEIRQRLPLWVERTALPIIRDRIAADEVPASVTAKNDKLFLEYDPLTRGTGYVRPMVLIEFGARSTGEPNAPHSITCDAAPHLHDVRFPTARTHTMTAERTFWEKATAIHVFCAQGKLRGERFVRHWHDVARLDQAGIAAPAIRDMALSEAVAAHKTMFFPERNAGGAISYSAAVTGALRLVPDAPGRRALETDYLAMIEDGLFAEDVETFDELMDRCSEIETTANRQTGNR